MITLKAHNLFGRYLMGYPVEQQKYHPLGNLILSFSNEREVEFNRLTYVQLWRMIMKNADR